jgi:hypothetical protein
LQTVKNAQHQCQIPVVSILCFGKLCIGKMGIQIPDGWGRLFFHAAKLIVLAVVLGRRIKFPNPASGNEKCSPAKAGLHVQTGY